MFKSDDLIGLDFETYASVSLPDVGLMRYVNDKYFEPTLASIAWPDGSETTLEFPGEQAGTLHRMLKGYFVSAHNAGFESAVLQQIGVPNVELVDSAVVAAVAGADRHLAGAAQQLMNTNKLDEDRSLLRRFAMPQPGQVSPEFDRQLTVLHLDEWEDYKRYCERDARLSRGIIIDWAGNPNLFDREMRYAAITQRMNEKGWPVDVAAVEAMYERYLENLDQIQDEFAAKYDPDLNLASHAQVKAWCEKRGIRSRSFDKQNVERMVNRLLKLRNTKGLTDEQAEVLELLIVKQELGGSSLKKLKTILDTQYEGRVYDQYVHAGAPQSLRTSGRSIQMQNLPRLAAQPRYIPDLHLSSSKWTNDELAENLRQVFRSSHIQGQLLVADFASIESRGLAYLAGETWKVEAYRRGEDVYKAQAVKIFRLHDVSQVDKAQRTTGKVGELSCGYGAGPVAVKDFAAKMHVELTESEAGKLVRDWRDANPNTVDLWERLGAGLFEAVDRALNTTVHCAHNVSVRFALAQTPASLVDQAPNVQSIRMELWKEGRMVMARVFHGCYLVGRDIRYYKPSSLKGGRPWKPKYTDPKTKRQVYYKLYGGKITGILVQSMCREIFFEALTYIEALLADCPNATLIGQFHDEIVVDWHHGDWPMAKVMAVMEAEMTESLTFPELPMGVEVKHDYRYTK